MKLQSIGTVTEQSSDALKTLVTNEVINACPILQHMEFYPIKGNADNPRKSQGSMTAGTTRAIGEGYTTPKTNTPQFADLALVIYGDEVNTDVAHERRGQDIGSQRVRDLTKFAGGFGRFLTDAIFNHDGSDDVNGNPTIKGLKKLALDASRTALFDPTGTGIVPTGNAAADRKQQQYFLEFMEMCIGDMQGTGKIVMAMNHMWQARLASVGREFMTTSTIKDIYGSEQTIKEFNTIPIVNPQYASNGTTLIMPNNEVVDLATDRTGCSSIMLMIFGEEEDIAAGSNTGLHVVDNGKVKSQYATNVELDIAMGLLNPKAILQITGLKLA